MLIPLVFEFCQHHFHFYFWVMVTGTSFNTSGVIAYNRTPHSAFQNNSRIQVKRSSFRSSSEHHEIESDPSLTQGEMKVVYRMFPLKNILANLPSMWKTCNMYYSGSCCGIENTDLIPFLPWIIKTQSPQLLFALEDDFILRKVVLSVVHFGCNEPTFQASGCQLQRC